MLAALGFILDGIETIGVMVAWGIETVLNSFLAVVVAAFALVLQLLPSMPSVGTLGGSYLGWLNWLFPFGLLLDLLSAGVTMWVGFLAVRFVLRLIHQV